MRKLLPAVFVLLLAAAPAFSQAQQSSQCGDCKPVPAQGAAQVPSQAGSPVAVPQPPPAPAPVVPAPVKSTAAPAVTATQSSFGNAFSLTAKVLSVPGLQQTAIATDVGAVLALSPSLSVREDSILVPADNLTSFIGSLQYYPPLLSFVQKATNLNAKQLQCYFTGGAGIDRISSPVSSTDPTTGVVTQTAGPIQQHIAAAAGGGCNYDPTATGHFGLNLFEVRWARLPGLANNTVLFSSGISITF